MSINALLSRYSIGRTITDYREILDDIIDDTGFEDKEIAERLGISLSSFNKKKRQKDFLPAEIEQIAQWAEEANKIEDAYFMKIYEERKDEENISLDEFLNYFNHERKDKVLSI